MPKKIIKYACGCISDNPPYIKHSRCLAPCPIHGEPAVSTIFTCVICGRIFEKDVRVHTALACSEKCRKKRISTVKAKQRKEMVNSSGPLSERFLKVPPRHRDCKYYRDCLDIGGKLINDPGACQGCKRYQPIDIEEQILMEVTC